MAENTNVLRQKQGENWHFWNGDCIEVTKRIPDNSIGYSMFSPPFASLFTYSDSNRDMGNSKDGDEFFKHFKFLIPELLRATIPGRLLSFHCMNLPQTIVRDGVIGLKDFRGDLIRAFVKEGWIHHSEVVIWKDPLVQAVRTKNLTLAHKQISKDATRCSMGFPDYIITMRKPGGNPEPVSHGRGFERYIGEMPDPKEEKQDNPRINKYSHMVWQRYASPVWMDIRQTDTLNVRAARSKGDEKHICPLQLQTVARCLELWTNQGDIVYDPFTGIGTVGHVAIKMKRKFIGCELKKSYFVQGVKNIKAAEKSYKELF